MSDKALLMTPVHFTGHNQYNTIDGLETTVKKDSPDFQKPFDLAVEPLKEPEP